MFTQTTDHHSDPDQDRELTDSDFESLIEDPHCRYLFAYLQNSEGVEQLSAVARYIVSEITDRPPDEVPESARQRTQTWLHHGFLPELDESGFIHFDPEAGTVCLGESSSK